MTEDWLRPGTTRDPGTVAVDTLLQGEGTTQRGVSVVASGGAGQRHCCSLGELRDELWHGPLRSCKGRSRGGGNLVEVRRARGAARTALHGRRRPVLPQLLACLGGCDGGGRRQEEEVKHCHATTLLAPPRLACQCRGDGAAAKAGPR